MISNSETGHSKNVANFREIISICSNYGETYKPYNDYLKINNLKEVLTKAEDSLRAINSSKTAYSNSTNLRSEAFKSLKPLSTKIVNALDASNILSETVKDARTINRKMQGARASKVKPIIINEDDETQKQPRTISTSQQSYDSLVEHYSKLIALITSETNYSPYEQELSVEYNINNINALREANHAVISTYTAHCSVRIERNEALYNTTSGLVKIAIDIKKYVKSIYGATSQQYKQISVIPFKNVKF